MNLQIKTITILNYDNYCKTRKKIVPIQSPKYFYFVHRVALKLATNFTNLKHLFYLG